jgi:putative ABC transport system substrate-binding protein
MSRPGGNVTGVSFLTGELAAKRFELLHELVPQAKTIAILINPTNARAEVDKAALQAAALSVGQTITVLTASTVDEIDTVFATAARQQVAALLINGDAFFTRHVPY